MGYTINSERDEEDEGTFVFVYGPEKKLSDDGNPIPVGMLHVPDDNLRGQTWQAGDVSVDKEDRRKGIAV